MLKLGGLLPLIVLLCVAGCVGDEVESDSSSSSSASSSSSSGASSGSSSSASSSSGSDLSGQRLYERQCSGCHGADGQGGAVNRPLVKCNLCGEQEALVDFIEVAMPPSNPEQCDEDCAERVAVYILEQFNAPQSAEDVTMAVRVWRLTLQEYRNSLASVLKLPADYQWLEGPMDRDSEDYFHTHSDFLQTDITTARYFSDQSAESVWDLDDEHFSALIPCDIEAAECLQTFTREFAARAFRRPVSVNDAALYETAASGSSGLEQFRRVAYGILNSPYFLYRTEIGREEDINASMVQLTPHEIASMLSFSLLAQPPSAELLAAADEGSLTDPQVLRNFVEQLLASPQAEARLHRFIQGWLLLDSDNWKEVSRDSDLCSLFDTSKNDLANEFSQFLRANATLDDGLQKLLTAYFPEPQGNLRTFYESGDDPAGIGPQRQGVLSSGMFAANHARFLRPSPVRRGVFIRERILCQEFSPPANVPTLMEDEADEAIVTNRDLYSAHVKNADCASCHQFFDPLGFTMEHLDACGRYRSLDNGQPVDTSGEIRGTGFDTTVADIDDLSLLLADQPQVHKCFTRHAFEFYRGQSRSHGSAELLDEIAENFGVSDRYGDILLRLFTDPGVLVRKR
jgi:hypothetical protein